MVAPNLGAFNAPTLSAYQRAEQEFKTKKQLQALQEQKLIAEISGGGGGNSPAAVKLANELGKARKSGDTQRINDLLLASKSFDKGVAIDEFGRPIALGGYGDAIGSIAGTRERYEADAGNLSDLYYKPETARATESAKLGEQLAYKPQLKQAEKEGARLGDAAAELKERIATFPQLIDTARELSKLGEDATFTYGGRAIDAVSRELGRPTEGGIARTKYMSLIDNQILPLLRQTFGAQFTVQEGESLRQTLGDANKTPAEKNAALEAFVNQKAATINSMERELGAPVTPFGNFSLGGGVADPMQASRDAILQQRQEIGGGNPYQTLPTPKSAYDRAEAEFNAKKQQNAPKARMRYNPETGEFE
jgi:hypothetical protein